MAQNYINQVSHCKTKTLTEILENENDYMYFETPIINQKARLSKGPVSQLFIIDYVGR